MSSISKGPASLVSLDGSETNNKNNSNTQSPRQLYNAVSNGNLEQVLALIKQGFDVDYQTPRRGDTPLISACFSGFTDIVKVLVQYGADVNLPRFNGTTPLFFGAQKGRTQIVEFLLESKAHVDNSNNDGTTPLMVAGMKESPQLVQMLLKAGADINKTNKKGSTALNVACANGNIQVVKVLLSYNPEINKVDSSGNTALLVACQSGSAEIVKILLQKGADPVLRNQKGIHPLYCAAQSGNHQILEILLKSPKIIVDLVKPPSMQTSLHIAASSGHVKCVQLLLDHKANPNILTAKQVTPFYIAAHHQQLEVLPILAKVSDINFLHKKRITPLSFSAYYSHYKTFALLLKLGADPFISTPNAFHVVSVKGCKNCVSIAQNWIKNNPGKIPPKHRYLLSDSEPFENQSNVFRRRSSSTFSREELNIEPQTIQTTQTEQGDTFQRQPAKPPLSHKPHVDGPEHLASPPPSTKKYAFADQIVDTNIHDGMSKNVSSILLPSVNTKSPFTTPKSSNPSPFLRYNNPTVQINSDSSFSTSQITPSPGPPSLPSFSQHPSFHVIDSDHEYVEQKYISAVPPDEKNQVIPFTLEEANRHLLSSDSTSTSESPPLSKVIKPASSAPTPGSNSHFSTTPTTSPSNLSSISYNTIYPNKVRDNSGTFQPPQIMAQFEYEARLHALRSHQKNAQLPIIDSQDIFISEPPLAKSAFATVFDATYCGNPVVFKQLHPTTSHTLEFHNNFLEFVQTLEKLNHSHIVLYIGATVNPTGIVMDKVPNRGLWDCLRRDWSRSVSMKQPAQFISSIQLRLRVALEIIEGLNYLHSLDTPLVHGDLTSKSVLLDSSLSVKLTGFGLYRFTPPMVFNHSTKQFIPRDFELIPWTAPEILRGAVPNTQSDIYSFGVILFELICPNVQVGPKLAQFVLPPATHQWTPNAQEKTVRWKDLTKSIEFVQSGYNGPGIWVSQNYLSLLQRCLNPNPSKRPKTSECLSLLKNLFSYQSTVDERLKRR